MRITWLDDAENVLAVILMFVVLISSIPDLLEDTVEFKSWKMVELIMKRVSIIVVLSDVISLLSILILVFSEYTA